MSDLVIRTMSGSNGTNISEQVEGEIYDVLEGKRPHQIRVIVEVPETDADGSEDEDDGEVTEVQEADDAVSADGPSIVEGDDRLISDIVYARAAGALADEGYETIGDLPDDLDNLDTIKGVGSGTVDDLREAR